MTLENITFEITAPFAMAITPPMFQVQATAEVITTRQRRINPGDVVAIDPTLTPGEGQMVLVDSSIVAFVGQQHDGVVTGFMSEAV